MAGKPIATIGSMHVCPMCSGTVPHVGGPVTGPGGSNVLINGKPAALMGDMCTCCGSIDTIVQGEPTVLINGVPVATVGSMTAHGGSVVQGEPTVLIGSSPSERKVYLPLKKIPFPKIRAIDRIGVFACSKSSDLKEAKANQDKIREEATKNTVIVSNLLWKRDGHVIDNVLINEEVCLQADILGIKEGEYITFRIFEKDDNAEDDFIASVTGCVNNGKVDIGWHVIYVENNDDVESVSEMQNKNYTLPEYVFKYDNSDGETVESNVLIVEDYLEIIAVDKETDKVLSNYEYSILLPNGDFIEGVLDSDGYAKIKGVRSSANYPIVLMKEGEIISIARE